MTIRTPGFAGAAGGDTRASDAAMSLLLAMLAFSSILGVGVVSGVSALIVDVDVDRPASVFLRGPR